MINPVSGKTMKNLRKRIGVRLMNNEKNTKHQQTNFYFYKNKSYTAIDEINSVLRLNTPIYVEFAVLELSK